MGVQKSKISKLKKNLKKRYKLISIKLKLINKKKYFFFLKKKFSLICKKTFIKNNFFYKNIG